MLYLFSFLACILALMAICSEDAQWQMSRLPGKRTDPGEWRGQPPLLRGGSLDCADRARRDLPDFFGHWTVCSSATVIGLRPMFSRVFRLARIAGHGYVMVDATIVKFIATDRAQGLNQAIGRSKGGMTTKILPSLTRWQSVRSLVPDSGSIQSAFPLIKVSNLGLIATSITAHHQVPAQIVFTAPLPAITITNLHPPITFSNSTILPPTIPPPTPPSHKFTPMRD